MLSTAADLAWLLATLLAFAIARVGYLRGGRRAWLHPVLTASALLIALLLLTGTDYATYQAANTPLILLLGPATVALAIPTFAQLQRLRRIWPAVLASVIGGSVIAMISAVGLAALLGLDPVTLRTLIPKSVTTPIAIGIAEQVGGLPALAAVIVILVGVIGAVIATPLLRLFRITDPAAQGVAIGLSAHGVGTARALEISRETGAYSGLAMGLTGLVTALLAPLALVVVAWF